MDAPWQPEYVFAVCQHGAEAALKRELAARAPSLRFAFSRPGFVTFKIDEPKSIDASNYALPSVLARTSGFSLGSVRGDAMRDLVRQVWKLPEVEQFLAAHPPAQLHVWQRDEQEPGERGFEPGPTVLAAEAEVALREAAPVESLRKNPKGPLYRPKRGSWALDVVLVEPNQWFVGCHVVASRVAGWPGGTPDVELPSYAVSRAYLKMTEAMMWSALPMMRGDRIVELGCAPGGASQALLDAGMAVIGVDPAEVDPAVLEHPRFTHVRRRTHETPHGVYRDARWLAADMNVAPQYTLDAAEAAVKTAGASIRGLLLTLKLPEWELFDELPSYMDRIRGWGYRDVRVRQLAFNRQEVCVAALRSRGQRRVLRRGANRRLRRDGPHEGAPAPHAANPQM
jgi:23S rRNA (cytidine2498-2'-O)-methyltransferase